MELLCLLSQVTSLNIAVHRYLNVPFVYVNYLIQSVIYLIHMEHFAGNSVEGNVKYEVLTLEGEAKIE